MTTHDVLVYHDEAAMRDLLRAVITEEGYAVTVTRTVGEALEALRSAPHPLVAVVERDHSSLPELGGPFFQGIEGDLEHYARHRYIALHSWTLSLADIALLDELGVLRLEVPFAAEQLLDAVRRMAIDSDPHSAR